ncbi:DEAD-box ATP-dependent RNA helicase 16-like [Silene latifolia]|uniref:DEAD-box ATP-dependent RNA helicase 16-like n=1 Tax=Silene latifolia TaxID=37657 RepID=UPI003D781569
MDLEGGQSLDDIFYQSFDDIFDQSFEDIGLDPRLISALIQRGFQNPTPIQCVAIPVILEGKDVHLRANTGSGKTLAYLLPLLHKLLLGSGSGSNSSHMSCPTAFVIVPRWKLVQQVYSQVMSLIEYCGVELKVAQLTVTRSITELEKALSGRPDILVTTPACVRECLSRGLLQPNAIQESLSMLIFDEADLLSSYGYEDDLRFLMSHVPTSCQCLMMTATSSKDVKKLKNLILHSPYFLTLPDEDNVDQFWISCGAPDKFLYVLALLKFDLVEKKVLLFANRIDMGFRLKLFLEKFSITAAVLTAELSQSSCLRIIEEFNAGLFDYLIAIDDSKTNTKEQEAAGQYDVEIKNSEKQWKQNFDAGIDFKNVYTVINLQMPATAARYIYRIGCIARACHTGASVCLVSPDEMEAFEKLKSTIAEHRGGEDYIAPLPSLLRNGVELLRHQAKDLERSSCM